jgi:hypothetical protein
MKYDLLQEVNDTRPPLPSQKLVEGRLERDRLVLLEVDVAVDGHARSGRDEAADAAVWRCPHMSRDKCGNRTQEVVGSIPISSTNSLQQLRRAVVSGARYGDDKVRRHS